MKKIISLALSIMAICSFSACESTQQPKDETVTLSYYQNASEMADALKTGKETVGIIAEPDLSNFLAMGSDCVVKLSAQDLYGTAYAQDIAVAKKSVIESDGKFITSIMNGIRQGAAWLKNNAHDGVEQVNHNLFGIENHMLNSNIDRASVERSKIGFKSASDAKDGVKGYLQALISMQENVTAIPSDGFFYDGLSESENVDGEYTIVAPDGIPAFSLAQLMYFDRLSTGVNREVEYRVVAPETISSYLVGEDESVLGDVVIAPVEVAAKLVGNGEIYQMIGVATQGNFYVVSNQNITSIQDLKGTQICLLGENSTIDLTVKYAFNQNQIVYKKLG